MRLAVSATPVSPASRFSGSNSNSNSNSDDNERSPKRRKGNDAKATERNVSRVERASSDEAASLPEPSLALAAVLVALSVLVPIVSFPVAIRDFLGRMAVVLVVGLVVGRCMSSVGLRVGG